MPSALPSSTPPSSLSLALQSSREHDLKSAPHALLKSARHALMSEKDLEPDINPHRGMSPKCQEETWPSEDARYWDYKEARLRSETPRNAISLQLLCVPLPLQGEARISVGLALCTRFASHPWHNLLPDQFGRFVIGLRRLYSRQTRSSAWPRSDGLEL